MAEAAPKMKERVVKGLVLGEVLGKGTFGRVVLGTKKKTGHRFALKFLSREAPNFKEDVIKKEINCMKKIRHKYVVALLASSMNCNYPKADGGTEKSVLMVLEFANGGDLYDVIYYSGPMKERLAATYFKQLLEGVDAIHKMNITHRDLKPNNVLIDHKFCLKITDFGLSHIGSSDVAPKNKRMKTTWVGTKGYRAPELVLNAKYSNMCDVFALGVCLFVMLLARQPFRTASSDDQWYKCIATKQFDKYWKSHDASSSKQHNFVLSKVAKDMLHQLLCYQPRQRITIEKALKHKWMQGEIYEDKELPGLMQKSHKASYEAKKKDPERQARLNAEGPSVKRSEGNQWEEMPVPELSHLHYVWTCYEVKLSEGAKVSDIFSYVQDYCTAMLQAKFKDFVGTDYAVIGTYKAVVDMDKKTSTQIIGETSFVLRMVKYEQKTLFVIYFVGNENTTPSMQRQVDTTIIDSLHKKQYIGDHFVPELKIDATGLDYTDLEFGDEFNEEEVEGAEEVAGE